MRLASTKAAAKVWDMYVGVELDILGRRTTLRQCSAVRYIEYIDRQIW